MVFSSLLQYTSVTEGTLLKIIERVMPEYIAPFLISLIDEAVSYTHLDVYKRQVQEHFDEIQRTFEDFQASVQKIKQCMGQILSLIHI